MGPLQHFSQEEKWYFQAPTGGLIWAACGQTLRNMLVWALVIQNSGRLRQTPALPPSQIFQLKNYDCGFRALNIIQVDVFWYLMMITCLISYSTVVSPEPLIIVSWKMAAHVWVRRGSSLCFMLGLSGRYWNLMNSFSMKVDFRSQSKKDGGEAKYVKGHTSKLSQGGHKRALFSQIVGH